jgi:lysophospholipase L1-like esterase
MGKVARFLSFPAVLFFILVSAAPTPTAAYPRSMAALGDSMTQATNACCAEGNHPAQSWSTGDGKDDGVNSHYERLLGLQPGISGRNHNDSRSGAKVADLPAQAALAASQKAAYITILVGANDLCASSVETMTSEAHFAANLKQALATLDQMRPRPQVFVSSIPNIHQLWRVLHTNATAQSVWSAAEMCQSMLARSNTEEMRQQVVQREAAFNAILSDTCAAYAGTCRSDGGAVYEYQFTADDVSTIDYFHPSLRGQARLAEITWEAAW